MKKRILTVLLAVCLVFALGTVTALADGETEITAASNTLTSGSYIVKGDVQLTSGALTIENGSKVTLTLDEGAKLTNKDGSDTIVVKYGGELTINGTGTVDNVSHQCAPIYNSGTVNINGGSIIRSQDGEGNSYYAILNHGTMTIDGATVRVNNGSSSLIDNGYYSYNSNNARLGYVEGENNPSPTLTISSGIFSGGMNAVKNDDGGNLTINGGSFSNTYGAVVLNWNIARINDGTFTVNNGTYPVIANGYLPGGKDAGVLTISGGEFTAANNGTYGIFGYGGGTEKGGSFTITGGTFKGSVATDGNYPCLPVVSGGNFTDKETVSDYFPSDQSLTVDSNGNIVANTTQSQARIGSTYYKTIADAISAAKDNDTVVIVNSFSIDMTNVQPNNGAITINKDITLDGNGKTITATGTKPSGSTHVILVTANGASVENLTIDVDGKATSGIQAYKADNVSIDDVKIMDAYGAAVIVNTSTVTASDLTTTGSGWGGVNVDNGDNTTGNAKFTLTSGNVESIYTDNTSTSQTATIIVNGGTVGTVKNDSKAGAGKNYITINNGYVGRLDNDSTKSGATIVVNGGNFGESVDEYAASNLKYEAIKASGSYKYTYHSNATDALQAAGQNGTVDYVAGNGWDVTLYYDKDVQTKIEVPDDYVLTLPGGTFEGKQIEGWKYGSEVFEPGDTDKITSDRTYYVILRNGQYNIVIDDDIKHGDVSTDVSSADKGATVYIYVDPDIGYVLDDLDVYYGYRNQYSVNVKFVRTGVYSFIMPGNNVYITATFRYESLPFTDVNRSQWFYDEVYYVYTNGMMEGDSATTFNPDGRMTRAMFWAVLGRIDGATITGNDWAEEARAWAMREGVSDGTNPNDYVTREQMVTMLWRYAGEKNGSASLVRYTDADKISSYAVEAMRWAIGNGIIEGMTSTTLEPQGTATRAQCAAIFMRFDQM